MSLSGGLAVATLYVLRFPHDGFAIGAGVIVAFILAVPGLIEPQIAYLPYKAWNKLAQTYGRVARFYLMAICFFIVLTVIGRNGSRLRLARPQKHESHWVPYQTRSGQGLRAVGGVIVEEGGSRYWVRDFLSTIERSGNWWAYCLLPFFCLIRVLEGEGEQSDSLKSIYTLY